MADESVATPVLYSQEQVQQILNVAIAQQSYEGEFSRSQLFEIADELGISHQCLMEAEQTWLKHQSASQQRLAFDQYRQSQLKHRIGRWGVTSCTLVVLNAVTGWSWLLYLVGLLSLRLGVYTWIVFRQNGDAYEQAFRRWARKRQLSQFVNHWWTRILSV